MILAVPALVVSVADVAVTVTPKSLVGRAGAVYVTAAPLALDIGDTPPQVVAEQDTAHVTPPLLASLPTVAAKFWVVVAVTSAAPGWMLTVIAGTVTVAEDIASGSPTEVAVKVTCKSLAGGGGALYVVGAPLAVLVGDTPPHGAVAHVTVQVTPLLLGSFTSVAVTCPVVLARTLGEAGATVTPTDGTITVAEADFVLSVAELPVTVTLMLLAGRVAGVL